MAGAFFMPFRRKAELFLMVDSRAKNAFPSFIGTSLAEAQEGA
jgi:hypothetical protein